MGILGDSGYWLLTTEFLANIPPAPPALDFSGAAKSDRYVALFDNDRNVAAAL